MKKLKKCTQLSFAAIVGLLFGMTSISDVNAMTTMPEAVDGVITLTENVELSGRYVIAKGTTLKIDLNGNTITGPSSDYAIENLGNLTIVDNGTSKGKISCPATVQACIRNLNTLEVDGVTVESAGTAIKNDAEADMYGNLVVNNSSLSSTYNKSDKGTIFNWGKATINNTTVNAKGVAIFTLSGSDAGKSSEIEIKNSELLASTAISSKRENNDSTTQKITVTDSTLKGSFSTSGAGTDLSVSGDIKVLTSHASISNALLPKCSNGTTVTLDVNFTSTLVIPEGITVVVPSGRTLKVGTNGLTPNGKLVVNGEVLNKNIYVKETNTYFPTLERAIYSVNSEEGTYNVKLLNDINETKAVKPYKTTVTIDLNGNIVTIPKGMNIRPDSNATIKDSSADKSGKLDSTITNDGNLTLESGNYTNMSTTNADAKTIINGGTYPTDQKGEAEIPDNKKFVQNADGTYSLEALADTEELEAILKETEKLTEKDYEKYTEESLNSFLKNLEEAEDLLNSLSDEPTERDQQTIDKITKLLTDGFNGLVEKQTSESKNPTKNRREAENPQTFDDTKTYKVLGAVALVGTIASGLYLRKNKLA